MIGTRVELESEPAEIRKSESLLFIQGAPGQLHHLLSQLNQIEGLGSALTPAIQVHDLPERVVGMFSVVLATTDPNKSSNF